MIKVYRKYIEAQLAIGEVIARHDKTKWLKSSGYRVGDRTFWSMYRNHLIELKESSKGIDYFIATEKLKKVIARVHGGRLRQLSNDAVSVDGDMPNRTDDPMNFRC